MARERFRVGIVGLRPGKSWAAIAHVPALRSLAADYEIVGVANTSRASAEAAAAACGIPRAFENVGELVASPQVDIVAVTVRVPHHFEITKAAIAAGKHVYCEWPLGNGLVEAQDLSRLALANSVVGVAGTQARVAPEVEYLRELIADGYVGEVLSTTLVATGRAWGTHIDSRNVYLLDRNNGATMLTIPVGHTLAAVRDVLGHIGGLSATLVNRRTSIIVADTGDTVPMTAHDQVLVNGTLASGATIAMHYRGGGTRGTGFLWEINGTDGDIQVTGASGHTQMIELSIKGARGNESQVQPIAVPDKFYAGWPIDPIPRNVARVYARMAADLRNGTRTAPSFADAVELHRVINAIELSDSLGARVTNDVTMWRTPVGHS